jgi:hypothetical protein
MPRRLPRANKCSTPGSTACYVNLYVPNGASVPPKNSSSMVPWRMWILGNWRLRLLLQKICPSFSLGCRLYRREGLLWLTLYLLAEDQSESQHLMIVWRTNKYVNLTCSQFLFLHDRKVYAHTCSVSRLLATLESCGGHRSAWLLKWLQKVQTWKLETIIWFYIIFVISRTSPCRSMQINSMGRIGGRWAEKYVSERRTFTDRHTSPPNRHAHIASAWTMLPAGYAARRDAVRDDIISTTGTGFVGAVTYKKYACLLLPCAQSPIPASWLVTKRGTLLFIGIDGWDCLQGQQIEEDPDDFGTQGQRHRVKKEKEERSRRSMPGPVHWPDPISNAKIAYRGRQAATLFLQAYQLILWKQCDVLVNNHGFPEQFEVSRRSGPSILSNSKFLKFTCFRPSFEISGLYGFKAFLLRINASADDEDDEESEREVFSLSSSW